MTDHPNFAAWQTDTLAKYALEQYLDNIRLREELEAVRLDNKNLLNVIRDIWKEQDVSVR